MKLPIAIFCFLCLYNDSDAQLWTFEYVSDYNSSISSTWKPDDVEGTVHAVSVHKVNGSGKDIRTGLIELDKAGTPVSLFYARESDIPATYYPYRGNKFISISQDCKRTPTHSINVFNNKGQKIREKGLFGDYHIYNILLYKNNVTFIKEEFTPNKSEDLSIVRVNKRLKMEELIISLEELLEEDGQHTKVFNAIQVGVNQYLFEVRLFDVINAQYEVEWGPTKIVMVNNGKIEWVTNLQGNEYSEYSLQQYGSGYIICGRQQDMKPVVIRLDESGNEIHRFSPISCSNGLYIQYYVYNDRVLSVDKKVHGRAIIIKEYHAIDGKLLQEWEIPTSYTRIEGLAIGWADNESLIITGNGHKGEPMRGPYTGFVMKVKMPESISAEPEGVPEETRISGSLISEVSKEVISVKVFPNPARFKVTFQLDSGLEEDRLLQLFDINGKEVETIPFVGNTVVADVRHLASGTYVYVISAQDGQRIMSGKLIKD